MTSPVQVAVVSWDDPDGAALRAAQRAEIATRYGHWDSEPGPPPSASDIAVFMVAWVGSQPAGCGGLRRIDDVSGEVKRMYVAPRYRGTGVSTAILDALEAHARSLGWTHLRLETGDAQPDAERFYTRQGYAPIPRFGHYVRSDTSRCYERALT